MKFTAAEKIANAVLYEGYMLYPYRPSALKNQERWNFGTLFPAQFEEVRRGTERSTMHIECLIESGGEVQVTIRARFLQFGVHSQRSQWSEAVERAVEFKTEPTSQVHKMVFAFPGDSGGIAGSIRTSTTAVSSEIIKFQVDLQNDSVIEPEVAREQVLNSSLISAHLLFHVEHGSFISLLDPPEHLRAAVAGCRSIGCFPVLAGEETQRNLLLCSPIILYDYPRIAPESAGDFFDGTEMDEMLTLRVMTMTDDEKQAMRSADERARALLEFTEQSAREQLARTHGAIRSMRPVTDDE